MREVALQRRGQEWEYGMAGDDNDKWAPKLYWYCEQRESRCPDA